MADCAGLKLEPDQLLAGIRRALSRSLIQPLTENEELFVVTLSPEVEEEVRRMLAPGADGRPVAPDPGVSQNLIHRVANAVRSTPARAQPVVLCASAEIRQVLRSLTQSVLPTVPFVAVQEIPDTVRVHAVFLI